MTQCHFEVFIHDVQAKIKEDSSSGTPLLFEHCFDNRVKSPEHATHILVKVRVNNLNSMCYFHVKDIH